MPLPRSPATSIRGAVVSSLRWLAVGRLAGQLITWIVTVFVIRILAPEDYGLMALAMLAIGLFSLFEEMGLAAAIVQMKELERAKVEQVFGLVILLNVTLYSLAFAAAPLIGRYFAEPQLGLVIRVAGLQLLFSSFELIPDSIVRHRMAFRGKSVVVFIAMVLSSLLTLVLALLDFAVWALVFGNLLAVAIRAAGLSIVAKYYCWPRFSFTGMRRIIAFGGNVTADRLLWFIYTRADVFVIGKLLGKELLGIYTVALHLASLPMQKLGGILNEVGFSAFSRVQDDRESVTYHLHQAVRVLGFFSFPVFFGVSAVAPEAVQVLLGEKWLLATLPLQILSLIMPLQMVNTVIPTSLFGIGRAGVAAGNGLIACLMMPPAFVIGVRWGLPGVCAAWAVMYPVYFLVMIRRSLPILGSQPLAFLRNIRTPLAAATLMYLVVSLLRQLLLPYALPPAVTLIALVAGGAACYSVLAWTFQRTACREVLALIRS